ncbi:MAG TPA: protein kinase, partial [Woeseiaceae bacterium]
MLRARQKLGKYRIIKRLAKGPLADVYEALDTIHKTHVALKLPKTSGGIDEDDFVREVRVAIGLQHPTILSVTDASYIDGKFVIVMPLGKESLADRMTRRMSTESALQIARQAITAVAFAH